jgi:hypothetical protein
MEHPESDSRDANTRKLPTFNFIDYPFCIMRVMCAKAIRLSAAILRDASDDAVIMLAQNAPAIPAFRGNACAMRHGT